MVLAEAIRASIKANLAILLADIPGLMGVWFD